MKATLPSAIADLDGREGSPRILVLFDIDGTLLTAGEAPRRSLQEALTLVYGSPGPAATHDFSGKTDPQIVRELLELAGVPWQQAEAGLNRVLDVYVDRLASYIRDDPGARLMPGVDELILHLARDTRAALGLLTGNLARGARIKLERFGLWSHFGVGAFGSDHAERNRLPAVAVARAQEHWGIGFPPQRTFVIGDTPLDIAAGRAIGAVTVGVDTGRAPGNLERHAPDHFLPDLSGWRTSLWPILFGERL
jgi:phosphoglycolate phosphatase